ncbi:hypothetical protein BH18ACT12_BH18ACT12_18300 [soil metagenome]
MYGLTRATTTLIFAAVAGLLIWFATQISNDNIGGYWARIGLVAGAGLLMALSQLLGGWTKWGWPRLSAAVLLIAFVPVAFVSLWVILAGEPSNGWFHDHVLAWSNDIHVSGLVNDLLYYIPVLAFGSGLVFGFSFDTTGPTVRDRDVAVERDRDVVVDRDADGVDDRDEVPTRRGFFGRRTTRAEDEPLAADEDADGVPDRETVTTPTRRSDDT